MKTYLPKRGHWFDAIDAKSGKLHPCSPLKCTKSTRQWVSTEDFSFEPTNWIFKRVLRRARKVNSLI